jgi:OmpA-OmpF porin, OOP family
MNAGRFLRGFAAMTLTLLGVAASANVAQAEDIDLPKFDPSPAGDRFFGVPSPYAAGEATFHGGVVLDYAHNPLVLANSDGETLGAIVEHQMFLHLNASFSIIDRIMINVDMPFALLNAGDGDVQGGGLAFTSPDAAGLGDLRAGLRLRIFGEYHDPFQIGLGGYVWFPTGTSDDFLTNGSVRGQPQLLLGGRADRFIWSVMAGPTIKGVSPVAGVTLSHQFNWGAGIGALLGENRTFQIGLESSGGVTLEDSSKRNTNAEALAGIKWRFIPFLEAGLAAGPGFTSGVGTPDFRGVFSLMYTPEIPVPDGDRDGDGIKDRVDACPDVKGVASEDPKKHGCPPEGDRDKDGIIDEKDACPDEPGKPNADPKKNGCPDRDRDKDGILDDDDACPDEPGVASDDPKKNGCPLRDKDGDGVMDDVDACPEIPGIKTEDPKTNGCPGDTDGDGFRDDVDACPREKGVDDPDPTKKGCPKSVRVTDKEIVILEQVQFDTAKSTIKAVSNKLLDDVAQVLKEHPEIKKIEVQGHTDNRAAKAYNQKLSDDRAKAVVAALIKRGVNAATLVAKGYGLDKPIADNNTEEGRQKNRRVQFIVLEKDAGGATVVNPGAKP